MQKYPQTVVHLAGIAALVCVSGVAFGQESSPKISLNIPATRLPKALELIGKQTGRQLLAIPAFENEPIIIACKDQPLDDVLAQIAKVAGGTWQIEGSTMRLVRPGTVANEERARTRALWAEEIRASRVEIAKRLSEFGKMDEARARAEAERAMKQRNDFVNQVNSNSGLGVPLPALRPTSPADLALWRLIGLFDPNRLAELEPGTRTVFAMTPTAMQRSYPNGANAIIREFVTEHNQYAKAMSAIPKAPNDEDMDIYSHATRVQPLGSNPAECLLIVHRESNGSFAFSLQVADQQGKIVASSDEYLNPMPKENPWKADGWGAKTLTFSSDAKEHARLLMHQPNRSFSGVMVRTMGGGETAALFVTAGIAIGGAPEAAPTSRPEMSTDWRATLSSPTTHDPLRYGISEAIHQMSLLSGKPIVALVPDSVLVPSLPLVADGKTANQWASLFGNSCSLDASDGWMVIQPLKPSVSRAERINRNAFQSMLSSIRSQNRLSLDAVSQYALSVTSGYQPSVITERIADLLVEGSGDPVRQVIFENLEVGKFYAQLGQNRRSMMTPQGTIKLMMLSPEQMATLRYMTFNSFAGTEYDKRDPNESGSEMRRSFAFSNGNGMMFRTFSEDLIDERTEHLPNGIPTGGEFSFQVREQEAAYALPANGSAGRFMNAMELGMTLGFTENNPNMQVNSNGLADYKSFQMGRRFDIQLGWQMAERISLRRFLNDYELDRASKAGSFDDLPGKFKEAVMEAKNRSRIRMNQPPTPPNTL